MRFYNVICWFCAFHVYINRSFLTLYLSFYFSLCCCRLVCSAGIYHKQMQTHRHHHHQQQQRRLWNTHTHTFSWWLSFLTIHQTTMKNFWLTLLNNLLWHKNKNQHGKHTRSLPPRRANGAKSGCSCGCLSYEHRKEGETTRNTNGCRCCNGVCHLLASDPGKYLLYANIPYMAFCKLLTFPQKMWKSMCACWSGSHHSMLIGWLSIMKELTASNARKNEFWILF